MGPHSYPNGISSYKEVGYGKNRKIGVLLIDHGSRRNKSNLHLEYVADEYEKKSSFIVQAAHMEIAKPSIEDGIQMLLEKHVEIIVCHPYFLSPGKHATTDVPNLISLAQKNLNTNIPIILTDPLGSHVDLMLPVIHNAIQNTIYQEHNY